MLNKKLQGKKWFGNVKNPPEVKYVRIYFEEPIHSVLSKVWRKMIFSQKYIAA